MRQIFNSLKRSPVRLRAYQLLLVVIPLLSLLVILVSAPHHLAKATMIQNSDLCDISGVRENCAIVAQASTADTIESEELELVREKVKVVEEEETALDTQVDLVPEIRKFYGGGSGLAGIIAVLFLTIGPLKIVPAFVKLTTNADDNLRKQLAFRGFLISTVSIVLAGLFGQSLLAKYRISLSAGMASAGIVLFLVALRIVLSQYGTDESPAPPPEKPSLALAIQPLTFPTILTPYGVAIVIILITIASRIDANTSAVLGIVVSIMVLNWLAMLYARQILNFLKPRILQVVGLVLGIVQLSLGISWIYLSLELEALVIKQLLTK